MPASTPPPVTSSTPTIISTSSRNLQAGRASAADSFLARHNTMGQPLPGPAFRYLDHTVYVVYEKSSFDNPFVPPEWQREGYLWPPPVFYDFDPRDVETRKAPFGDPMGDGCKGKGPLLSLLEHLDGDTGEASNSIRQGTRKLVIKSEHENMGKTSYRISPDLLGKVLDKLPNLNTLSVGLVGIKCTEKHAPDYRAKFRLDTLEACWEPLEACHRNAICGNGRLDYTSFYELLAMFSHIENLRFVNATAPWDLLVPRDCGAHGLIAVHAVYLTPLKLMGWNATVLLKFLQRSLDLSALEKLVVDDICQKLSKDINKLLSRAVNLSSVTLSFQYPAEKEDILGDINVSGLQQLEELTLDILVRSGSGSQPEWEKAIKSLESAAYTPVKTIVLRFVTRLVPPEGFPERAAWLERSAADAAKDLNDATWPPLAWDAVQQALREGFRGLRIECHGPASWAQGEGARAQSTLGETLSEFIVLGPESSPKA